MDLQRLTRRAFGRLMRAGLTVAGLAGISGYAARNAQAQNGAPQYPEWVPGADHLFARIEEIYGWGIRRPAYPADRRAEDYLVREFEALGLVNVRQEPAPVMHWEPTHHALHISAGDERFEIDCFPLPLSALEVDLELELALFDAADPAAVTGRAALHRFRLMDMPATMVVEGGPELEKFRAVMPLSFNPEGIVVDPGGTLSETRQILPFPPEFHEVIEPSQEAGAAAFIGVLEGHPGDICEYYVPYDARERPFPAVWIRESDGNRLGKMMASGTVTINLKVKATSEAVTTYNIVGELPGADDEILLIASHHDGPWASAVEDASGISLVLGQAEYWSKVPQDERPHAMQFLLQAGHMAGSTGAIAFTGKHRDMLERIVLEVHLEHAANEVRAGENGPELTGQPEPRWFFTSRNKDLQSSLKDALLAENLDRSLILAPDVLGRGPTTDGGMYHVLGVPIVNYLTAPFYLFDTLDTPDKIDQAGLEAITRATIRVLQDTAGVSAAQMRAGIAGR